MKVMFIDTVHPVLWERLETAGYTCEAHYKTSREELLKIIGSYDGIVIRSRIMIDREFIDTATSLKWIARSGAGMENIDVECATGKGIKCYNSPEGNRDAVGEQAIGMLLMLLNNLKRADMEVRNGIWRREENRGHEIARKTVGIIGYGNMGRATAKKFSGFDCKVLAYDKYKTGFSDQFATEAPLEEIREKADIISLHLPLTPETHYYINDGFIDGCKKSFWLINTARGQNVETAALLRALDSGKVRGACLDVLEFEQFNFEKLSIDQLPEDFKKLVVSDKVILSPHIAGWTYESHVKLSSVLADKILAGTAI